MLLLMSGDWSSPPSNSWGIDLAFRASDFGDFDEYNFDDNAAGFDGMVDGEIRRQGDVHAGHYLLAAGVSISMTL
jgi:hypothetical protein